jgi:hypothetical protein
LSQEREEYEDYAERSLMHIKPLFFFCFVPFLPSNWCADDYSTIAAAAREAVNSAL